MPVEKFKDLSNLPEEKKAEYFDQMLNLFFRNGFGQVSKPQMELFLFSIYLDPVSYTHLSPVYHIFRNFFVILGRYL